MGPAKISGIVQVLHLQELPDHRVEHGSAKRVVQ